MKEQNMRNMEISPGHNEEKRKGAPEKPQNQNFYMRVLCLILIIGAIFFYNYTLNEKERDETISDLSQKVAELESQQKEILTALEENYEARKKAEEEQKAQEAEKDLAATADENVGEERDTEEADSSAYKDGTYTGDGQGFGGNIQVQITIESDTLKDIQILSAPGEDSAYLSQGKAVIDSVLSAQSTDVDTVSGATFGSTGILMAIEDALGKAENG